MSAIHSDSVNEQQLLDLAAAVESFSSHPIAASIVRAHKGHIEAERVSNAVSYTHLKDGMLHISKMADHRVEKVEDVMNIGDEIEVKVSEIDSQGRVNLIRNDITYPCLLYTSRCV